VVGATVTAYAPPALPVGSTTTAADGSYVLTSLDAGTYHVRVLPPSTYAAEVYDDLRCGVFLTCPVASGTDVTVSLATTTPGIDFALDPLGRLSGTITAADSGEPLQGYVQVFEAQSGQLVTYAWTYPSGFTVSGLYPGDYLVMSDRHITETDDYHDELYRDVLCAPSCDLSRGAPLHVDLGAETTFGMVLHRCAADVSRRDLAHVFFSLEAFAVEACEQVSAGAGTVVGNGADVTFRAGRSIVLGAGFSVEEGGSFKAVLVPSWGQD
jgi:hypothetical protein